MPYRPDRPWPRLLGDVWREWSERAGCRVAVSAQLRRSVVGGIGASVRPVVPSEASAGKEAPPSQGMSTFLAVAGPSGPARPKVPSPKTENIGPSGAPGPVADPASIVRHWPGGASALGSHRPNSRRSPITTQPRSISGLGGWASTQVLGHPAPQASCALARRQPPAPGGRPVGLGRLPCANGDGIRDSHRPPKAGRGDQTQFREWEAGGWGGSNPIPGMGSRPLGRIQDLVPDRRGQSGGLDARPGRPPSAVGWSWRPTGPTAASSWVVLAPDRADRRRRLGSLGLQQADRRRRSGGLGLRPGRPPSEVDYFWFSTTPTAVGGRFDDGNDPLNRPQRSPVSPPKEYTCPQSSPRGCRQRAPNCTSKPRTRNPDSHSIGHRRNRSIYPSALHR